VSTHNKRIELEPENASLSGNTWPYAKGFQPIAALGVLSHVALRQCFEHTGNQKADTFGL
jgi:hypothetical protein